MDFPRFIFDAAPASAVRLFVVGSLIASLCGCGSRLRSRDEVDKEREQLPRVYLSSKSQKRIIAPGNKRHFVDPETKEEFAPALQCTNPECPGRQGTEPYLFNPFNAHGPDGVAGCPACLKANKVSAHPTNPMEGPMKFVKPYELPEFEAARKRLNDERERIVEAEAKTKRP